MKTKFKHFQFFFHSTKRLCSTTFENFHFVIHYSHWLILIPSIAPRAHLGLTIVWFHEVGDCFLGKFCNAPLFLFIYATPLMLCYLPTLVQYPFEQLYVPFGWLYCQIILFSQIYVIFWGWWSISGNNENLRAFGK
mgnify:CR=1 FL=1